MKETTPSKNKPVLKASLTKQFGPFLKFQRIFGRCPLKFHPHGPHQLRYSFQYNNPPFFLSLTSAFLISATFLVCILQGGSVGVQLFPTGDVFPPATFSNAKLIPMSPFLNGIVHSFEIISIIHIFIDYLIVWCKAPELAKWLNSWNEIEEDLEKWCYSKSTATPHIYKFQRYFTLFYVLVPALIFGTLLAWWEFDIYYPIHSVLVLVYSYGSVICYGAEDAKAILMFKCLKVGFAKIRTHLESNTDVLNPRKLEYVISRIRSQADHCGRYMAFQQLLFILVAIYFSAASLFAAVIILTGPLGDTKEELLLVSMVSVTAVQTIARLYFKVWMAVGISMEEKKVAVLIKREELGDRFVGVGRMELKNIHDMLINNPTEISLNDFVKLNNRLILGVFQQIFTQFIVFMQFQK